MKREDYVSLKVAKMLREKGFNEYCGAYYHLNWDDMTEDECFEVAQNYDFRNKDNGYRVAAPTLYEVQKWLRKKHNIYINSIPSESIWGIKNKFTFMIDKLNSNGEWEWGWEQEHDNFYTTYEESFNEGILIALKEIKE